MFFLKSADFPTITCSHSSVNSVVKLFGLTERGTHSTTLGGTIHYQSARSPKTSLCIIEGQRKVTNCQVAYLDVRLGDAGHVHVEDILLLCLQDVQRDAPSSPLPPARLVRAGRKHQLLDRVREIEDAVGRQVHVRSTRNFRRCCS